MQLSFNALNIEFCRMKRLPLITKDGSVTLSVPEMNVTYHSVHGAIQESQHVFIDAGLKYYQQLHPGEQVSVLEVGFGTGLNALLSIIEAEGRETSIYYVALEPYPLTKDEISFLNYCQLLKRPDLQQDFLAIHECEWNKSLIASENIIMHKSDMTLKTFTHSTKFHLVYYDVFAPSAQPELWTKEIFEKLHDLLHPGGILVTYCSKGEVRRAMQAAGFLIEKIQGPPGKREMVRAVKKNSQQ